MVVESIQGTSGSNPTQIYICSTFLIPITMLQKRSKCEVKAAHCGNLPATQILREIKFCEFKMSKMSFLALLKVLNFNFNKFEPFLKSQIYQNSKLGLGSL